PGRWEGRGGGAAQGTRNGQRPARARAGRPSRARRSHRKALYRAHGANGSSRAGGVCHPRRRARIIATAARRIAPRARARLWAGAILDGLSSLWRKARGGRARERQGRPLPRVRRHLSRSGGARGDHGCEERRWCFPVAAGSLQLSGGTPMRSRVRFPVVALVLSLVVVGGTATAQSRVFLLTPDEAAKLRLGPEDRVGAPLLRSLSAGPRIVVREPPVKTSPE